MRSWFWEHIHDHKNVRDKGLIQDIKWKWMMLAYLDRMTLNQWEVEGEAEKEDHQAVVEIESWRLHSFCFDLSDWEFGSQRAEEGMRWGALCCSGSKMEIWIRFASFETDAWWWRMRTEMGWGGGLEEREVRGIRKWFERIKKSCLSSETKQKGEGVESKSQYEWLGLRVERFSGGVDFTLGLRWVWSEIEIDDDGRKGDEEG